MKCQLCDGKGEYMHAIGGYRPCEHCNGTGKIVQTNEKWFCGLSTEEKAKVLRRKTYGNGEDNEREEQGWVSWLQAKHQDNPPDIPNVSSWDEWLKEEKTKCSRCGGTDVECEFYGKYECPYQPLTITNAECIRRCDDATLAFKIWKLIKDGNADSLYHIERWLKEKHE